MQYFYLEGQEQRGPFSLEELHDQNISRQTLVWASHMQDWQPAGTVAELQPLFSTSPPPHQTQTQAGPPRNNNQNSGTGWNQPQHAPPRPKTYLLESILATLFCCLPLGIVGIVNASRVDSRYSVGDYAGAEEASREARKWTIISVVVSLVLMALYFILMLGGIIGGSFLEGVTGDGDGEYYSLLVR